MSKTYPSKSEYERALDVVSKYEKRQETLQRLTSDLSHHLQKFETIKFKVSKKEGKVLFTGVIDGQIKIGESVCAKEDVFNEVIGKLIAVKKALGLDISDVVEHVERNKWLFNAIDLASIVDQTNKLNGNSIVDCANGTWEAVNTNHIYTATFNEGK